jgi:hypothetical protein
MDGKRRIDPFDVVLSVFVRLFFMSTSLSRGIRLSLTSPIRPPASASASAYASAWSKEEEV